MPHQRETIRSALATAVTSLSTTGARVYVNRVLPLEAADLPALCVYTRVDTPDYPGGHMGPSVAPKRLLEAHVVGYVDGDDQTVLDDIASEVETAVFASSALAATCDGIWLGEQTASVDGEGETLISMIDMVFNIAYRVAEGAPGTKL